jgi:hypothetical protein
MKNKTDKEYFICDQCKGNAPYVVVPSRLAKNHSTQEYMDECDRIQEELGVEPVFTFSKTELITFLTQIEIFEAQTA